MARKNESKMTSPLSKRIEQLTHAYMAVPTHTGSPLERQVEPFFKNWVGSMAYFQNHPDCCGFHQIPGDHLERSVCWALLQGQGAADKRTIVMIHHYDTADVADFGLLQDQAYFPGKLAESMATLAGSEQCPFPPDVRADLASGDWMFGRGGCDMKAGGAMEMALMEQYAQQENFSGNLLLLAVPDEENLSAGMRGAIPLMRELQEKFGLEYQLLLNAEPHTRPDPLTGVLYEGSAGKIMPLVYVKGQAAHVGQVFGGLNPILLLAEIVRRTELNTDFQEQVGGESTPPPVWLNMKDRKYHYDVSLPLAAAGYLSILTLEKTPSEHLARFERICREAFASVIAQMNTSHDTYSRNLGLEPQPLPWVPDVRTFDALHAAALEHSGPAYRTAKSAKESELKRRIAANEISLSEAGFVMIELALAHSGISTPVVVIALSPPYYPSVSNQQMRAQKEAARSQQGEAATPRSPFLELAGLGDALCAYAQATWQQDYQCLNFFTNISDLSYAIYNMDQDVMTFTKKIMPLWGDIYSVPFELIRALSMPVLNIGPWGKDFHKNTERVYTPDLYQRSPALMAEAIRLVFQKDLR